MAFSPSSPLTGGAQTGLTSPTYTLTDDRSPTPNGEQVAVTALGGTQSQVTTHSVSSPFTITMERPAQFKQLGTPNPSTGVISNVPRNVYKIRTRKGVAPAALQPNATMIIETTISVPAGADVFDAPNIRAALSAHIGCLNNQSAGIGDTVINGVL